MISRVFFIIIVGKGKKLPCCILIGYDENRTWKKCGQSAASEIKMLLRLRNHA